MPKHKVFVGDYGRSGRYAIRKRNKERLRQSRLHGDPKQRFAPVRHGGSSSSESDIENSVSNELHVDCDVADHAVQHENQLAANDSDEENAANSDLDINNDTDFEFDAEEFFDAETNDDDDEPLYEGAPITLGESMLAILTFVLANNLTGTALSELLLLISMHCIQPNLLKKSLYLFRKYFDNIRYPLVKHYFCSACILPLATITSSCDKCNGQNAVSYFIEIPILSQLQMLFNRPGLYEKLRHRFHRKKSNDANLEDIYDGDVYKELSRDGEILSTENNISFMWNTDGIPIFKSSGFQIWPFYLTINELPFSDRTKPENILLAGLWFGPRKPSPNLFLQPFHSVFRELSDGVYLNIPIRETPVKVRGIVMCGTCDLPAKSLFLNTTQFNGKYGCPKCKLKGRSEQGVWTYPFKCDLRQRTEEETRVYAEEALEKDAPVYGVKGSSVLDLFVYKYIRTTSVDSMHCVFAGVVKKLCCFFFDPSYGDHPASLNHSSELVDSRLCALSPPSFLQRRPRSIKNHFKYWKANELKAWFFYYSLPILYDIMLPEYFEHYSMLVLAIYALHQTSVSAEMLEKSSRLLTEFVNRFDVLYGERYMSCNLHQLLHIPETVRDFGPLWVTSCFSFENLNGKLKRLVHSSRHPELQICSAVSSLLNLSSLRFEKLVPGSDPYLYCGELSNAKKKIRLGTMTDGISCVGRCCEVITLPEIVALALERANISGRKFKTFSRLMKDRFLYTSESYSRSTKYNNTCVRYNHNDIERIGIIHSFVKVYNCVCQFENMCECYAPTYAIIRECCVSSFISADIRENVPELLVECSMLAPHAIVVNADQLICVCFLLNIADLGKRYIALPANVMEVE